MMFLLLKITRMESGADGTRAMQNQDQLFRYFSCLPIGTGAAIFREWQFRHVAVFGQHFKPLRLYRALMALSEVNSK